MTMRNRLRWVGVTALLLVGCDGSRTPKPSAPAVQVDSAPAEATRASEPVAPAVEANPQRIEALIEQLAISQEPAGDRPIFTPSRDTPRSDPRVIAYEAAEQLKRYGKAAFPYLLKHFDDRRQSVAFRRIIPHDVGLACFCIIEDQVFDLPADYRGSFYRTGADGESHLRPRFGKPGLFTMDTVEAWLNERQHKSLEQMQVEALEWLIEQEKQIGLASEADKNLYLYPLERQLVRAMKNRG